MSKSVASLDVSLADLIEAWLGAPPTRLDPRFPPALERVYAAETAAARQRAAWVSSMAGCIAAVALVVPGWNLLSDAHALDRLPWLEIGVLISVVSHLLMYAPIKIAWREVQIAVAGILVAVCIAGMLSGGVPGGDSLLLGSIVLILLLGLIGSRFPFQIAALYAPALLAVFLVGIGLVPHEDGTHYTVLSILMMVITFYAAFGNWRLEAESRRSYALMLSARLRQQDLSSLNSELDDLARRDPLTGLANRRAYDERLESAWERAKADGTDLGLIFIDVDNFKLYNDSYGHPDGDACLQAVATCLRRQLRGTGDFVARLGGEEFAVILPGATLANCGAVAERLRHGVATLKMPRGGKGEDRTVTVSVGAANAIPGVGKAAQIAGLLALVHSADQALYAAKQGGRNCVYLAGTEMSQASPWLQVPH